MPDTTVLGAGHGPVVRGSILPLSYASGRYTALVQLVVEGSPLAGAEWTLGLTLSTDGRTVHGDSASARPVTRWLPVVFEREIEVPPGRHAVTLEARETNPDHPAVNRVSGARLDIDWPDPTVEPVIVGSIAVMQPMEALFVRHDTSARLGPVDQSGMRVVDPSRPTYMVSLVCRGGIEGRIHVLSTIAGGAARASGAHEPALEHNPCAQIRDLVPELPAGPATYEIRIALVPNGTPVARSTIVITVATPDAAETERHEARRRQVERLLDEGNDALVRGALDQAESAFDQAFAIEPHYGIAALRDGVQDRREQNQRAERAARERERAIADGLARARSFAESELLGAALAETEAVLALDPAHPQARALHDDLGRRKVRARTEAERQAELAALREKVAELTAGADHAGALAAANRALSLDPEDQTAQRQVVESYRALGEQGGERANHPPIIEFLRLRGGQEPGEAEIATTPTFALGGSVIDESDVTVRFVAGPTDLDEPTVQRRVVQGLHITEFVVRHRLGPELTFRRAIPHTLTAIATDSEGAESRRDHAVIYRVPIVRSLWLWTSAACVMAGAVAGWEGLRLHRRRQKLRRRFNPYVVGAPVVRAEQFFGRDRLIQRVLQAIPNNSVLLWGERRIGKTSLQHRLYREIRRLDDPDYAFFPVFIDLQGTPQERLFRTIMHEVVDELGPNLREFAPHPTLAAESGYGYSELVRDMREVLSMLARDTRKQVKLVLQLDEIDELNAYDPRVNQQLRSLFMRGFAENLVTVVSGVAIRKDWASHGSPWYNFFEEIEVRAFDREDAEALVRRPIAGVFQLGPGVVDRVVQKSGCKPYLIQRLCTELVSRAHEAGRGRITVEDVEDVGDAGES